MTKRTDKKRMGASGFTLIELMIVIAIIGILAAIAIPNFLLARNKSMYTGCLQSLQGVSKGIQSFLTENSSLAGITGNNGDEFCNHIIPGYDDASGCAGMTATRIAESCDNFDVRADTPIQFQYEISGNSQDKTACYICVTEAGYCPHRYTPNPDPGAPAIELKNCVSDPCTAADCPH